MSLLMDCVYTNHAKNLYFRYICNNTSLNIFETEWKGTVRQTDLNNMKRTSKDKRRGDCAWRIFHITKMHQSVNKLMQTHQKPDSAPDEMNCITNYLLREICASIMYNIKKLWLRYFYTHPNPQQIFKN